MECLNEIVQLARRQSLFFANHLKFVEHVTKIEDLPIIDHAKFWAASRQDERNVMTGTQLDGIVTRTGGTTHSPKSTCYSQIELHRAAHLLGLGLLDAGLRAGDRIGNLFYAGDLYASFIFEVLSLLTLPVPAVQIPIGSTVTPGQICDHIWQCRVSALMGPTTVLVTLAEHCSRHKLTYPAVHSVMYGGEPLFAHQAWIIKQAFPKAVIRPCIYASADGGMIASSAAREGEDHRLLRVFKSAVLLEIVTEDEEQSVIRENHVAGSIIVTNLARQLCPVLRYPTGDRAEWVDRETGVFRLLGRASTSVRIGSVSLDVEDLRRIVTQVIPQHSAFQAIVRQTAGARDQLECLIATNDSASETEELGHTIVEVLHAERPMFREHVSNGWIAPLKVSFVRMSDMKLAVGSGKLREVVDLRFGVE